MRWIVLTVLLVVAVGLLGYAVMRPTLFTDQGALDQPSTLPSLPVAPSPPTGTPPPEPQVMLAVGDIGSCPGEADDAVAQLASRLPGTIAVLGDVAYQNGTERDFARCFDPAWGPMISRIRPTPGNHDYLTADAAPYFAYFGQAAGEPGRGWYSYDLGAWHVVVLNSNCSEVACGRNSPQVDWLQSDLAQSHAKCLVAYWHHPRWSSGRHGSSDSVDAFWQVLVEADVDVVLNGHDHTYERISRDGVREFVVGTGGRSLYPFEKPALRETEARSDDQYGLLWLALGDGTYDWQFLGLGNSGFTDSGSGAC